MNFEEFGAIILAAGKGTRMKSKDLNKVVLPLADKPMIIHTIERLEEMQIKQIVVVVGFAKKSVMDVLGNKVLVAEQIKRLGTAHAVSCGLKKMPANVKNVLVINGDDSAFYTKEIVQNLIDLHSASGASVTLLTIEKENPYGLGRIVRDLDGKIVSIIEEKDATDMEKNITEVNPACYIFKVDFLHQYLNKVQKSEVTGEYYLTSLIHLAIQNKESVQTFRAGAIPWRGVNTKDELEEAEKIFLNHHQNDR